MKKRVIIGVLFCIIAATALADFATGNQLFMEKKYEQARTVFLQDPSDFKCEYGVAVTSQLMGDYQTAIEYYQKTLVTKPDFFNGLSGLAFCYQMTGDIPSAISTTEKAIAINPTEQLYISLGQLYLLENDFNDAQSTVKKGILLYPTSQGLQQLTAQTNRQMQLQTVSGGATSVQSQTSVIDSIANSESGSGSISGVSVSGDSSQDNVSGSED